MGEIWFRGYCGYLSESAITMTDEELIKGLICIRYQIEEYKDILPIQTDNQLKVIDEVIEKIQGDRNVN